MLNKPIDTRQRF